MTAIHKNFCEVSETEKTFVNCELLVRKRIAAFVEHLFRFLNYDFRHDAYKQIVYGEAETHTPLEEKIKNYYDAYVYLLSNGKNPLTMSIFRRFLFLINGKEADVSLVLRITTLFYKIVEESPIERATLFHIKAFEEMAEIEKEQRFIVSLMLFNYSLVKSGIPAVMIQPSQLAKYMQHRDKFINGADNSVFVFMAEVVKTAKVQDKSYYKNLVPITVPEIYKIFTADRQMLFEKYGVKHMYIFGSCAKGLHRIDSDIDLLVNFSHDLTQEEKERNSKAMFDYYTNLFRRFVDINEVGDYLSDEIIKSTTKHKKIF